MNFEKVKGKFESKHPNLKLLEYNGYYNEARFLDTEYGEFSGTFQTVSSGNKNHPNRVGENKAKILFLKALKNLKQKQPHLKLLKFNGWSRDCLVLDNTFGEFSGVFDRIILGKKSHPNRTRTNRDKKKNLKVCAKSNEEKAINLLKERFSYMTLLKYNGSEISKFFDEEYGEFYGKFSKVVSGSKRHPKRSAKNKYEASQRQDVKDKRAETCLRKYGSISPLKNKEIKEKIKKTNIDRYGYESASKSQKVIQKSRATRIKNGNALNMNGMTGAEAFESSSLTCSITKFINLVKQVGYESALEYTDKTTDIEFIIKVFLEEIEQEFIFNKYLCRTSLSKYRPDFVVGNLIIEADGLKYHSDEFKDRNYHKDKKEAYNSSGYNSLFFRSDEIIEKTNIVKSIIRAKLGIVSDRFYARKCSIIKLNRKEHITFFNDNHLMGSGVGRTYALQCNEEIVAAISIVNKKKYMEVSRYCNKTNSIVLGGFSRLLKFCVRQHSPLKIVSFVDCRYGDGHSLLKQNFVEESNYVSFKWTDCKKTCHRMKYPGNSGYENGFRKIWDCGQKKFTKTIERK